MADEKKGIPADRPVTAGAEEQRRTEEKDEREEAGRREGQVRQEPLGLGGPLGNEPPGNR